jgi:hypothetical protein
LNTSAGKTMKHHIQRPLLTVALGILAAGAAFAQTASRPGPVRFETVTMAVEVFAGSVTLPNGPNGTFVMAACHDCPLQSFTTDAATGYFVDGRPATLAEVRAAATAAPRNILTASYRVKTGVVTQISAVQ